MRRTTRGSRGRSLFQHVFDSYSLIEIERKHHMTDLRKRRSEVVLPKKVAEEVGTRGTPLFRFIRHCPGVVSAFDSAEESAYLQIRSQVGIHDGEAAAIAVASVRKIPLVIEDKRGKAKAASHGVSCLTWNDFIHGN